MKKVNINDINKETAALIINNKGEIIIMENDTHRNFFSKIIAEKLNIKVNEDRLDILINIIIKNLNYISYIGCTSGDREYNGGIFHVNSIESLTNEQLSTLIDLYSNLSLYYNVDIINVNNNNDEFISIGEIFEEKISRTEKSL